MKTTLIITLISLLTIRSCQKSEKIKADNGLLTFSGTILKIEYATTFRYGTHLLNTGDSTFALTSSMVDLNKYVLEPVTVTAKIIKGYPVDDGPVYLDVISVTR